MRSRLRLAVQYEKLRIATRELLPRSLDGADVDVTAAEIADLAEASIEVALAEAQHYASPRLGPPVTAAGTPSTFVVLGMGKLGGRELNAGSDVDLIYLYDTDDGRREPPEGSEQLTLHQYWSRVARRLTANLDDLDAGGHGVARRSAASTRGIARPDCQLAPRCRALLRDLWTPVGARGDAPRSSRGREISSSATRRSRSSRRSSTCATSTRCLPGRSSSSSSARAPSSRSDPERDLKLGRGGIREAEFFVQSLQLIWGGKEPRVRATGTLDALRRLRGRGLVTDREGREVAEAYVLFRRLEHRIQWATGLQTHLAARDSEDQARLARSLGYATEQDLNADIERARAAVGSRLASLLPTGARRGRRSR